MRRPGRALEHVEALVRDAAVDSSGRGCLPCELRDLEQSWDYFRRADLHKLSAVDATSFAMMKRARVRRAFAFDHHCAAVGFKLVA